MISQDPETTTELKNALQRSDLSVYLSQRNSLLISHILSYTSICTSLHDTKPKNTKGNSFSSSPQPLAILWASLHALPQKCSFLFCLSTYLFHLQYWSTHLSQRPAQKLCPPADLSLQLPTSPLSFQQKSALLFSPSHSSAQTQIVHPLRSPTRLHSEPPQPPCIPNRLNP